jgi:hypothetical protein
MALLLLPVGSLPTSVTASLEHDHSTTHLVLTDQGNAALVVSVLFGQSGIKLQASR